MAVDLAHTDVLVLDCQTTGGNPQKARLLEIGWARYRAVDPIETLTPAASSFLIQLSDESRIPAHVARLTGITDAHMQAARTPFEIRDMLWTEANSIAALNGLQTCPTVIHYSRFELPFLKQLHRQQADDRPFPFNSICTHALSGRMVPQLPRKGLRAVAGYFGHSVPELKRCAHHVLATAFIWHRLVAKLAVELDIRTLDQLTDWLASGERPLQAERSYPLDPVKRSDLPDRPGVYRMLRSNGDVLYIGKAKSIRKRVASYYQKSRRHAEHILEMLSQARDIDCTATASAVEAAALESDLIKQLNPPYNVALRSKDRQLCFLSSSYDHLTLKPDRQHPVGPLPFLDDMRLLPLLAEAIVKGKSRRFFEAEPVERIFSYYDAATPDGNCLKEGLRLFSLRYAQQLETEPFARACRRIGRELWRQHTELLEADPEEETTEQDPIEDFEWTPAAIAGMIEGVFFRFAHHIRRSRWLARLCDSTIIWDCMPGIYEAHCRQYICLQDGYLTGTGLLNKSDPLRLPPARKVDHLARRQSIDVTTYDRLRVITTELRRLLAEERGVEIWIGSRVRLKNIQLSRVLKVI